MRRCGSEQLGHDVEGFKRPIEFDELDEAVYEMSDKLMAEVFEEPVSGPSIQAHVAELEAAVHEGATLWVFEGPWPSWEGIAAVRGCEVVTRAIVWHH